MSAVLLGFTPIRTGYLPVLLLLGLVAVGGAAAAVRADGRGAPHSALGWANAVSAVCWPMLLIGLWVFPFARRPSDPPITANAFPTRPTLLGPVLAIAIVAALACFIAVSARIRQLRTGPVARAELVLAVLVMVLLLIKLFVVAPAEISVAFGSWLALLLAVALTGAAAIRVRKP